MLLFVKIPVFIYIMKMIHICFAVSAFLFLSQAVSRNTVGVKGAKLDDVIANHPIIMELMSRVAFLEERDKINTEIIGDLKAKLERFYSHRNHTKEQDDVENEFHVTNASSKNEKRIADKVHEEKLEMTQTRRQSISSVGDQNVESTDGKNRVRQSSSVETVAFFAKSSTSDLHIGPHQNIIFEVVDTNIGNAFNPHHGIFVAPMSGTYLFFTHILANNDAEIDVEVAVNGVAVANAYARGTDGRHDSGSQTIIVNMNQGDDVSVRSNFQDESIYGGWYTTFSGFLLRVD